MTRCCHATLDQKPPRNADRHSGARCSRPALAFVTQVIAIALAVAVGLLVTVISGWQAGLLAGIIAYAIVMKLAWYLEIFDMIGLPSKKRAKLPAKDKSNP